VKEPAGKIAFASVVVITYLIFAESITVIVQV